MRERKNPPIPTPPDYTICFGECPSFTMEMLKQENAELTTHINELEKERVQLDDVIKELSSKCGQLEYDRDALAVMKDELSSKTEQLEKKLHIVNELEQDNYNERIRLLQKLQLSEKKLKIAMEALELQANLRKDFNENFREFAKEALKQIKEVK